MDASATCAKCAAESPAATATPSTKTASRIVSASMDKTVRVWDAEAGTSLRVLEGHTLPVKAVVAYLAAGSARIASASMDKTVRVWDAEEGTMLHVLTGHEGSVGAVGVCSAAVEKKSGKNVFASTKTLVVAAASHGPLIVSGADDKTVRLWDSGLGTQLRVLKGHQGSIRALTVFTAKRSARDLLAHAAGSARIVTASDDSTVRIWNADAGTTVKVLKGHTMAVHAVATYVAAGNTRVVSGSSDKTVRVWDVASGTALKVLEGHKWPVKAVAAYVGAGGSRIVSTSNDMRVIVWDGRARTKKSCCDPGEVT